MRCIAVLKVDWQRCDTVAVLPCGRLAAVVPQIPCMAVVSASMKNRFVRSLITRISMQRLVRCTGQQLTRTTSHGCTIAWRHAGDWRRARVDWSMQRMAGWRASVGQPRPNNNKLEKKRRLNANITCFDGLTHTADPCFVESLAPDRRPSGAAAAAADAGFAVQKWSGMERRRLLPLG